ncbi:MAG: restriction endonuclease [Candidatus Sericytochromatia bacterium]|nr:restriction endonuclease [Candidatus Sericytochromatia bacterium]
MTRSKNTGKPYEKLTQSIFQQILNQSSEVQTVQVEHDVLLQGITTTHQIDVYWRFQHGGVEYQSIVQAKDWNSKVSKEKLLAFHGVLNDLPGQPRGIFVTRRGYQKGAKEYAQAHGIVLYELREAEELDWQGFVRSIEIEMRLAIPEVKQLNLVIDPVWFREKALALGFQKGQKFSFRDFIEDSSSTFILDSKGQPMRSLFDIFMSYFPKEHTAFPLKAIQHQFIEPSFIALNHELFPKVKLLGLDFNISQSIEQLCFTVTAGEMVQYILKETLGKEIRWFPRNILGDRFLQ